MSSLFENLKNNLQANEDKFTEENYQKMFPKIARDYITRDELKWILNTIFNVINNVNPELGTALYESFSSLENQEIAIQKSQEYNQNLERPDSMKATYKDLK